MIDIFDLWLPKLPKISFAWDVEILFRYLETQGITNVISLKLLTQKLAIFSFLPVSHRTSTINSFRISGLILNPGAVTETLWKGKPLELDMGHIMMIDCALQHV